MPGSKDYIEYLIRLHLLVEVTAFDWIEGDGTFIVFAATVAEPSADSLTDLTAALDKAIFAHIGDWSIITLEPATLMSRDQIEAVWRIGGFAAVEAYLEDMAHKTIIGYGAGDP